MKALNNFYIFLFLNIYFFSYSQERLNLNLISNFSYEQEIFDIWGYTFEEQIDSTIIKREFALVGAQNGISIVEITNPETPIEIAFLMELHLPTEILKHGRIFFIVLMKPPQVSKLLT